MIDLSITGPLVQGSVGADDKLPEVATVIQWGLEWFMSCGVHKWQIDRTKNRDGSCLLRLQALCEVQATAFSSVTNFETLAQQGYFPQQLSPNDVIDPGKPIQRMAYQPGNFAGFAAENYTVFGFENYKPHYRICEWSYGMADCLTGFFYKGAMVAKFHGSIKLSQLWLGHGMTKEQFREYFTNPYDYDPNATVSELPIKWSPEFN